MPIYDFVEIGTSDFDTLIENASDATIGLSIEPIRYYLDRLPTKPNVKKLNCAVSNQNGEIEIYYIPPNILQQYGLPDWLRGCNSVGAPHPTANNVVRDHNLNPSVIFQRDIIRMIDFETLCKEQQIEGIRYLKVDTEGHDCVILRNLFEYAIACPEILPKKILFESNILQKIEDIRDIIAKSEKLGYRVIYSNTPTASDWGTDTLIERD